MQRHLAPIVVLLLAGCSGCDHEIWNAGVRALTLSHGGDSFAPTEACPSELVAYTLTVSPPVLDASRCRFQYEDDQLSLAHEVATVPLTAAEMDALVPTLETLRVVDDGGCGADKPAVHLTITTATGVTEYTDSFYSGCPHHDPLPAADSDALDAVEAAFRQLAFPSEP